MQKIETLKIHGAVHLWLRVDLNFWGSIWISNSAETSSEHSYLALYPISFSFLILVFHYRAPRGRVTTRSTRAPASRALDRIKDSIDRLIRTRSRPCTNCTHWRDACNRSTNLKVLYIQHDKRWYMPADIFRRSVCAWLKRGKKKTVLQLDECDYFSFSGVIQNTWCIKHVHAASDREGTYFRTFSLSYAFLLMLRENFK